MCASMFMKYLGVLLRMAVIVFFAMMPANCFYRDPYVNLENGYGIVAICAQCDCGLTYDEEYDKRSYSDWRAYREKTQNRDGKQSETFFLINETTGETLKYPSEKEWLEARTDKKAKRPLNALPRVEGITGFAESGTFTFGNYDYGYFVLDMENDDINVFKTEESWEEYIESLACDWDFKLQDPKGFWVQYRHPAVYCIFGGIFILSLPWIVQPLRRRKMPIHAEPDS